MRARSEILGHLSRSERDQRGTRRRRGGSSGGGGGGRTWRRAAACGPLATGGALRLRAARQPHVEHGVHQRVEAGALGEHPAREDALLLAVEQDLVDLHERGRPRRLGRRAGVADARRDLEGAERLVLLSCDGELLDGRRHLVEGGEHGMAFSMRWACAGTSQQGCTAPRPAAPAAPCPTQPALRTACIANTPVNAVNARAACTARVRETWRQCGAAGPLGAVSGPPWRSSPGAARACSRPWRAGRLPLARMLPGGR